MRDALRRYAGLPRNVVAIGFVSLLNDASSEIVYPLLPLFLSLTLGATPGAIGAIEGAAESLSSLLKLASGYWSDRRGSRKGFVVGGYALAGAARTGIALALTWPHVLALRLVDRVGKGIRSAPRDAMLADSAPSGMRGLAFGLHRAMDHTGAVVGPVVGFGLLLAIAGDAAAPTAAEFSAVFLAAGVPAVAAVLVAAFVMRESGPGPNGRGLGAPPVPRLTLKGFDPNFIRFLGIVALFTLSNSSDAFLLLRASEAGVPTTQLPLLWAALHVSKAGSSLVGGHLSDTIGRKRLIVSGWVLYAAVYAGFAYVSTPAAAWALFLVYGVYFGLAEGAEKALVTDLVAPDRRGTAFGLYNFAFGVTVFPASLLMGGLWSWFGARTAFIASAALSLAAAGLLLSVRSRRVGDAAA